MARSHTPSPTPHSSCPFPHCVPWRCLLLDARNMSHDQLTVESARSLSPLLSLAVDCHYINTTNTSGGLVTPVYALSFPLEELGQLLHHHSLSVSHCCPLPVCSHCLR